MTTGRVHTTVLKSVLCAGALAALSCWQPVSAQAQQQQQQPEDARSVEVSAPVVINPYDRLVSSFHRLAENDLLQVTLFDGRADTVWEKPVDGNGEIILPYIEKIKVAGLYPNEAASLITERFQRYYKQPQIEVNILEFGEFEIYLTGSDRAGLMLRVDNGTSLYDILQAYVWSAPAPTSLKVLGLFQATQGQYRRVHLIRGGFDPRFLPELETLPAAPADAGAGQLLNMPAPSAVSPLAQGPGLAQYLGWSPWVEARLKDPNTTVQVFDPLKATREGNLGALAAQLQPGDVIYLPTPERSVEIRGKVGQPGHYEILDEKTVADVLRLAGSVDLAGDLCDTVIERRDDCCTQGQLYVDLVPAMHDMSLIADVEVQSGDIITVEEQERRIFVMGEVHTAGAFPYSHDDVVTDYLALAGGVSDTANQGWMAIIRQNRDKRYPLTPADVIQLNFKEMKKGHEPLEDLTLLPGDMIYVPAKGQDFSFQQVLSSLSSGIALFSILDQNNNSSSTDNTGTTPPKTTGN